MIDLDEYLITFANKRRKSFFSKQHLVDQQPNTKINPQDINKLKKSINNIIIHLKQNKNIQIQLKEYNIQFQSFIAQLERFKNEIINKFNVGKNLQQIQQKIDFIQNKIELFNSNYKSTNQNITNKYNEIKFKYMNVIEKYNTFQNNHNNINKKIIQYDKFFDFWLNRIQKEQGRLFFLIDKINELL